MGGHMPKTKAIVVLSVSVWMLLRASSLLAQDAPDTAGVGSSFSADDAARAQEISLGSGDLLTVSVAGAPEYHYDVRVSSAGEVSLPMLGNVKLAALSTAEAESVVAKGLEKGGFFNDPQVSIFVKEYGSAGISVLGEVQKPGIYPLLGHRTLQDSIAAAGGTTPKAGKTATLTHRGELQTPETISLTRGNSQTMTDLTLRPGDTVVVSKAGMVYVIGAVREPTGIVLDNPHLTVLQAIAIAHGTNPTASLKSAKLIRKANSSAPHEVPVPLDTILSAKTPDLELEADDVLFVPNSKAKTVASKSIDAILQTAVGVAIYGRY